MPSLHDVVTTGVHARGTGAVKNRRTRVSGANWQPIARTRAMRLDVRVDADITPLLATSEARSGLGLETRRDRW